MATAETVETISGNVGVFLESLPKSILDRLYVQPATCLALLRMLPDFAKHIVLRLLYVKEPVHDVIINSWTLPENSNLLADALARLTKLHIVIIIPSHKRTISLNKIFQENLHNSLVGGGKHSSFGQHPETADKSCPAISFLDQYAKGCWESILHFLVGTPSNKSPKAMVKLLEKSGLMIADDVDDLKITAKGFQFLLQDVNVQIWAFLLQYLEMAEQLNMELADVLNFFFQLGSLKLGQDYSVETLTPTQAQMLEDLKHLGLIYQRKKKSSRFYPTRLATTLTSGAVVKSKKANDLDGFILVETNYRVYAYTSSPLQVAVLSLFISMKVRFPNMIVGIITRESVKGALSKGITAEQIITYLTTHAHPEMRKGSPVLPVTVIDQIRLWEMESNRLRISKGVIYDMFKRDQDYYSILKNAVDFGYELWHSDKQKMIVVSVEGHEQTRAFLAEMQQKQS